MKASRILILLLALALCFGCISCTDADGDTSDGADDGANTEPQKEFSEITETGEEKFDPDATVEDFVFAYDIRDYKLQLPVHKKTFRPDEAISIYGYIANVSEKDFTYIGLRGDLILSLYCETDDGKYVMANVDIKSNGGPKESTFKAGTTRIEYSYCFYSKDHNAPAGSYHLEIGIAGFTQTFYNVLTIVE